MPEAHVKVGRTRATVQVGPDAPFRKAPIRITASREKPDASFVAVRTGGWWYAIDVNDLRSKRVFSMLNILLQLAQGAAPTVRPVVTVPAGG